MDSKTKSSRFWPQGKEYYYVILLIAAIAVCGVITYGNVLDKIEKLCNGNPKFSTSSFNVKKASIPVEQIFHGGPPKDGIPSLTNPSFVPASSASYMKAPDRVIGVSHKGKTRAYPLKILSWHECVNDTIEGKPIAVTYCPLCDSSAVFERMVEGEVLEFGISGLLYQSNMLLFDRRDDPQEESLWSQLMGEAVAGPKTGTELKCLPFQLMSWEAWKELYPGTSVLTIYTGHSRCYDINSYEDYFNSERLVYPINHHSEQFEKKEQILGLRIGNQYKAIPLQCLDPNQTSILDKVAGKTITLKRLPSGQIKVDADQGVDVFRTFWFAWYTFYPQTDMYEGDALLVHSSE